MNALKKILLIGFSLSLSGQMTLARPRPANDRHPLPNLPDHAVQQPDMTAEKLRSMLEAHPDPDTLGQWLRDYNYLAESDGQGRFRKLVVSGAKPSPDAKNAAARAVNRPAPARDKISISLPKLRKQVKATAFRLGLPDGKSITLIRDDYKVDFSGLTTWTGHLAHSPLHRAVLSLDARGVDGQIMTPGGTFRLESPQETRPLANTSDEAFRGESNPPGDTFREESPEETSQLLDLDASGLQEAGLEADVVPFDDVTPSSPTRVTRSGIHRKSETAHARRATISPGGLVVIDILAGYTKSLASPAFQRKLNLLIALANQAFKDSKIDISLRLAGIRLVDYPDDSNNTVALNDLTEGRGTLQALKELQRDKAADAVILLRNFVADTQGGCGGAWVNGASGSALSPERAYAVVSIGKGQGQYCSNYAMAHEIGHLLGGTHDEEHAATEGRFPYAHGYGKEGRFGDIMSYFSPEIGLFSNPRLTLCDESPCGIPNQADLAKTFNKTARIVSGFAVPPP